MSRAAFARSPRGIASGALFAAASLVAAPLAAQTAGEPHASLWLGAGGVLPISEPGVARAGGAGAALGLDVGVLPRLAVRVELSADAQELRARAGGPLGGDHQRVRAVVVGRVTPVTHARVAPYLLAGGGAFWQSDRITLRDLGDPVPDAAYRQTSSRVARGALVGAGVTFDLTRTRLFAEARGTRVGARAGATTDLGLVAGVALPLVR